MLCPLVVELSTKKADHKNVGDIVTRCWLHWQFTSSIFVPISFYQNITNLNGKYIKAVLNTFVRKIW